MKKLLGLFMISFLFLACFSTFVMADETDKVALPYTDSETGEVTSPYTDDEKGEATLSPTDNKTDGAASPQTINDTGDVILPYTDVSSTSWYYFYVDHMYQMGAISSSTNFYPNNILTRAQLVKILSVIDDVDISQYSGSTPFTDVSPTAWYAPYVQWAYEKGLVNGTTATTFSPDNGILRQDVVVILGRYFSFFSSTTAGTAGFQDISSVSSYATNAVNIAYLCGIIRGDQNNRFNPHNEATRAEGSALLSRALIYQTISDTNALTTDELVDAGYTDYDISLLSRNSVSALLNEDAAYTETAPYPGFTPSAVAYTYRTTYAYTGKVYGSWRSGPSGKGPSTLSLSLSKSRSYNISNSISGSYFSLGNITGTMGITIGVITTKAISYSVKVPSGKKYQIIYRPAYSKYKVTQKRLPGGSIRTSYVQKFTNWDFSYKQL